MLSKRSFPGSPLPHFLWKKIFDLLKIPGEKKATRATKGAKAHELLIKAENLTEFGRTKGEIGNFVVVIGLPL